MMLGPVDFLGSWTVTRLIADRLAGVPGSFRGEARWLPEDGALRYREEGWLSLAGNPPIAASRDYLWRFTEQGVDAMFADGRPFHSFRPEGTGQSAEHVCGEDLYRVTYDFGGWPSWTCAWSVTGPRKDYVMTTGYSRP